MQIAPHCHITPSLSLVFSLFDPRLGINTIQPLNKCRQISLLDSTYNLATLTGWSLYVNLKTKFILLCLKCPVIKIRFTITNEQQNIPNQLCLNKNAFVILKENLTILLKLKHAIISLSVGPNKIDQNKQNTILAYCTQKNYILTYILWIKYRPVCNFEPHLPVNR